MVKRDGVILEKSLIKGKGGLVGFRKTLRLREKLLGFRKKSKNWRFFEKNRKKNILRLIKDRWSFEKQKPRFSKGKRETRFHYHCYIGNNPKSSASI